MARRRRLEPVNELWPRLVHQGILLFVVVAPLLQNPYGFNRLVLKDTVIYSAALLFLFLWLLDWLDRGLPQIPLRSPQLLATGAYLAWGALSITWSDFKVESVQGWLHFVEMCALMLVAMLYVPSVSRLRIIAGFWAATSGVAALIGILQFFDLWFPPSAGELAGHWKVSSTLGHPNFLAAYIVLSLPLIAGLIPALQGRKRWTLLTIAAIDLFALLLSVSRGGYLGLLSATAVFLFLVTWTRSWAWVRARILNRRVLIPAALTVTTLIILASVLVPIFFSRLEESERERILAFSPARNSLRMAIWTSSLRMALTHPILGYGIGSFDVHYPDFQVKDERISRLMRGRVLNHAHSEYLEVWIEEGLIGLIIYIAFLVSLLAPAVRRIRSWNQPDDRYLLFGLIAGIAGFLTQNLVSVTMRKAGPASLFFLGLGMLVGITAFTNKEQTLRRRRNPHRFRIAVLPIALSVLLPLLAYHVRNALGDYHVRQGVRAIEYGDRLLRLKPPRSQEGWDWIARGVQEMRTAMELNPHHRGYRYEYANALVQYGDSLPPSARRNELYRQAIQVYQGILEINPNFAAVQYNLALAWNRLGEWAKVIECAERTLEIDPYYERAYSLAGAAHFHRLEYDAALQRFLRYLQLQPVDPTALNYVGILLTLESYKAFQDFRNSPGSPPINTLRLAALTRIAQTQLMAEHYFKRCLANADSADCHLNMGILLTHQHRYYEAALQFLDALELPDAATKVERYGDLFATTFRRQLEFPERYGMALYGLALIDLINGDTAAARSRLRQIPEGDPYAAKARRRLAKLGS
jgi:O-antigen ligase/tetratricopeptide (TPR) repeat protein